LIGGRLLDVIKAFYGYLCGIIQPAIEFCDMHLRGEPENATPAVMTRSSPKLLRSFATDGESVPHSAYFARPQ
jgi:hypothetical protein